MTDKSAPGRRGYGDKFDRQVERYARLLAWEDRHPLLRRFIPRRWR